MPVWLPPGKEAGHNSRMAMAEARIRTFQLSSNELFENDFQSSEMTSDAGLVSVREQEEFPGIENLLAYTRGASVSESPVIIRRLAAAVGL